MPKVPVKRFAIALLFEYVEKDVRSLAAAMLGKNHRSPDDTLVVGVPRDEHEQEFALLPFELPRKRSLGALDGLREPLRIVGQVHRVEVLCSPDNRRQIGRSRPSDVEHGGS